LQLLSPTIILPLGILVPIYATKYWHNKPLQQFMSAYKIRTTLVPLVDILMLIALRKSGGIGGQTSSTSFDTYVLWGLVILSTALQTTVSSLQFNAQMTFFAKRVDPAIGGSYMTLLNTAANLGGTWPASVTMWLVSKFSSSSSLSVDQPQRHCTIDPLSGQETCVIIQQKQQQQQQQQPSNDPFFRLQIVFSILGCLWIFFMSKRVQQISDLPDDAWRTHILDMNYNNIKITTTNTTNTNTTSIISNNESNINDIEMGDTTSSVHSLLFQKVHPGKSE
jgi:MFS transporter, PAT family, solute carrier family 33 (acetyl-CoA transportor), member 1